MEIALAVGVTVDDGLDMIAGPGVTGAEQTAGPNL
jgi:hypothetical protein